MQHAVLVVDAKCSLGRFGGRCRDRGGWVAAFALPASHGVHRRHRRWPHQRRQRLRKLARHFPQSHAILRPARPRHAGFNGRQVQLERVTVDRLGGLGRMEEALLLHVGLDQLHVLGRAARELEIAQGLLIDRENADGGAVLGAMFPIVARSASGSVDTPGPKNSTNFPTTPLARSICVTVSTRSVAVAPSVRRPLSRNPTTCGMSIETGWPSMAASASMPPTPQPTTPSPLIIVV